MKLTKNQRIKIRKAVYDTISKLRVELQTIDKISAMANFKIAQIENVMIDNIIKTLESPCTKI